jgi:hypothetical protein
VKTKTNTSNNNQPTKLLSSSSSSIQKQPLKYQFKIHSGKGTSSFEIPIKLTKQFGKIRAIFYIYSATGSIPTEIQKQMSGRSWTAYASAPCTPDLT